MANGFGFMPYPQRPSVAPQDVGAALARNRAPEMQQQQFPMMGPSMDFGMEDPTPPQMPAANGPSHAPRAVSSRGGGEDDNAVAIELATQEAARRLAGGPNRGSQPPARAPYSDLQLERMGLSKMEIQLLKRSGGVR